MIRSRLVAVALAGGLGVAACSAGSDRATVPEASTDADAGESSRAVGRSTPADADPLPRRFRTDVTPSGNRLAAGRGSVGIAPPVVIDIGGRADWVVAWDDERWLVSLGSGGSLLVGDDGTVESSELGAGPFEVVVDDGSPTARSATEFQTLFSDPLPDARVVESGTTLAALVRPTDRYPHGVLGDAIEAAGIELFDAATGTRQIIEVDGSEVVEGISPMFVDIDDDGTDELLATVSNPRDGARLVAWELDGAFTAASDPIGTGNRWRNQLAVAPIGPDGVTEVIDVRVPHLAGTVEFLRLVDDQLTVVASIDGFTSHWIGSRNLDVGIVADADGDGALEVVVPTRERDQLALISRSPTGAELDVLFPLGGRITSNVAARTVGDRLGVALATEDGRVVVWP